MSKKNHDFPSFNPEFRDRVNDFLKRKPESARSLFRYYMAIGAQKKVVPFPPEDAECEALARAMREDVSCFFGFVVSDYLKIV